MIAPSGNAEIDDLRRRKALAREELGEGGSLEGGESVNRESRGGKNYREYNGYQELQRKIKQSEVRKKHAFAGTSIFDYLKERKNSIDDVANDWLESDLEATQIKVEAEKARSAEEARRIKAEKDATYLQLDHEIQGKKEKKKLTALEEEKRIREVSTPDYAYRVLDSKCSWNEKQASRNGSRLWRLTQQLEIQSVLLTKKKKGMVREWCEDYEDVHHKALETMDADLTQQDRDRYTRLVAKMNVISADIDSCVNGTDGNHGNLELTLRAMRLNADKEMYMEKAGMHKAHPWYFQLLSMMNRATKPIFSRAEEKLIESFKMAAEKAGKLTMELMMEVAAEAPGLDTDRDQLKIVLDCCMVHLGLTPGSDEHGLWNERINKRIVTVRKPRKVVANTSPSHGASDSPVIKPTIEIDHEGDKGGSFYLTALSPPAEVAEHFAGFVNE